MDDKSNRPKRRAGAAGSLRRALGAALVAGCLGDGAAFAGPAEKPEAFKEGIKAQDRKEWQKSIGLMRAALDLAKEDGQRVRIYGTRYHSYLPHYYLGLAFYEQGNCAEALKEWDESLAIGFIQKSAEFDALLAYQANCLAGTP